VKDPVVTIEYANLGFNVLGEVNRPGRYIFDRDHLTILDAISMAGDLTIQGRRYNVFVMRKTGDMRTTYRVNLQSGKELLQSPAFYLQQNDVVYVEPNNYRARQTTVNGNNILSAPFWISVASLLTSIAVLIVK
jgi:polysaccharide export outer membrane protein